ncbi:MAG: preprotein translocase subunit SecE [Candidatus Kerfeldbacteria bacterium RIFCSPHIGHO2_12_FULL_48_17]|uniref:Protein translocase subunit SecE n=1 Tax=Candidatus Kerfeldbacteria bacterium RIFCSPHIGHO2_12_FULL_48_17 TaxID=1798542 RepID=A0A1G2B0B0_9BACT|nr:MAG: preprotein translocase subunit SecE [Candidatus Kerfeldbacteria bacterium RIFCSPHIGHO2_12_FULL_48_17]
METATKSAPIKRLTTYLKESFTELKKVVWPTREETTKETIAVILACLGVGVFLGALDFGFSYLLKLVI